MLLKIIGSILVLAASSFLGYFLSRDCSKRPNELRVLQGLLQVFENEISYLSNILTYAFEKVYKSTNSQVGIFFKATVEKLGGQENLNASQAWECAIRENIERTALNKEDEEILIAFGKILGSSDIDGQIKNIRLAVTQLGLQEQKAEESRKKNEVMYKRLGVLAGLALVIILV